MGVGVSPWSRRERGAELIESARANPWALILGAAAVLRLCERYSVRYERNVVDDAMTSMQYAKQLASGNGLVFNVGERVEGFTNFAWVVMMTPIYWLSTKWHFDFVRAVIHFEELLAVGVVAATFTLVAQWFGRNSWVTLLAVGLLVVDNSFTVWAILGLEVHALALFMLLALLASASRHKLRWLWMGLSLLGAHLTRPDAGLFCVVLLANEALEAYLTRARGQSGEAKERLGQALLATGLWLLPYAGYFWWRYRYFGYLMPNTYYLKLGGDIDAWGRGLEYLTSFLVVRLGAPLLALLAFTSLRRPIVRGMLAYNLLHALYVTYVGGDFFSGHRFFVPELPQLAVLAAIGLHDALQTSAPSTDPTPAESLGTGRWLRAAAIVTACTGLGLIYLRGLSRGPLALEVVAWHDDLSRQSKLFRWLKNQVPPGGSVANTLIGHTGFYSDARVIDLCGVIDPVTAHLDVKEFGHGMAGHEKLASAEYILAQRPTFIALGAVRRDLWPAGYYLRGDVPAGTFAGIWQQDSLLTRGAVLVETRVSFDSGPIPGWVALGDAFDAWPSTRNWNGQGEVVGASHSFVNSYHPQRANDATGSLTSAPFELKGELFVFRIAGGEDIEKLRAELLVGDERARVATGGTSDYMTRRSWDITGLRGQTARFRVVDESTAPWGYLAVDEIYQWQSSAL